MANLKTLYNVNVNLKGIAKLGYCRPTIAEMWDSSEDYSYPWCSVEPVWDNLDNIVYDNDDVIVTAPL